MSTECLRYNLRKQATAIKTVVYESVVKEMIIINNGNKMNRMEPNRIEVKS